MSADVIRLNVHGNTLIESLEHALRLAKNGELAAVVLMGVNTEGDYTIGGIAGNADRLPIMSLIGELEHHKQLLLERVERE